ncbi:hypothetical protein, partial [Burkholderia pseudomallei]|uniref:hypothetical protein n=1 Tax=Burkholderia pseudomallei TaxID=28450 RepID=UPI0021F7477E
ISAGVSACGRNVGLDAPITLFVHYFLYSIVQSLTDRALNGGTESVRRSPAARLARKATCRCDVETHLRQHESPTRFLNRPNLFPERKFF